MFDVVVSKTLRVPRFDGGTPGDGTAVARQLDAALIGVGFAPSRELMDHVGGLEPGAAIDLAAATIRAVRHLVGDHAQHNAYFINFPHGVPATVDFWVDILRTNLLSSILNAWADIDPDARRRHTARVDLLAPPVYGRYQHSYADLLAVHDDLIACAGDRITVLHLGGTLAEETARLYRDLAGRRTPLGEDDAALLARLATDPHSPDIDTTPVRETRAIVNAARLIAGRPLVAVDTVTDVLRILVAINGGDLTLSTPTRFARLTRAHRRTLVSALHDVVTADPDKLADVPRHAERWKRAGRVLHPRAFDLPNAVAVFDVAAGRRRARSVTSRFENAMRQGSPVWAAVGATTAAPGLLIRQADRLLRDADPGDVPVILAEVRAAMPQASGRVLLSLREHVQNRGAAVPSRMFVGRTRRAWVTGDTRSPLPDEVIAHLAAAIDAEVLRRGHPTGPVVIDPAVRDIALPLSGRAAEGGFAVLPRGSRTRLPADADIVRLFVYWRQVAERTDYDLSTALLDAELGSAGHVSWTGYHAQGITYSGDLVDARDGATEFIDVRLREVAPHVAVIMPQVHRYTGEAFPDAAESMFGWMVRDRAQEGMPFEARTVRTRSDMRGAGQVALPMALVRDGQGWSVVWTHLYLRGYPDFNTVEGHRLSTAAVARGILDRRYLTVGGLLDLWAGKGVPVVEWRPDLELHGPVTYVGVDRPEGLPAGSDVYTIDRLANLVPA